jgi:hypothetical protein
MGIEVIPYWTRAVREVRVEGSCNHLSSSAGISCVFDRVKLSFVRFLGQKLKLGSPPRRRLLIKREVRFGGKRRISDGWKSP